MKRILTFILSVLMLAASLAAVSCKESEKEEKMHITLINKQNPVGADYIPESLIDVDTSYTNGGKQIQLEKNTAEAAIQMLDGMKAAGIKNVTVTSGYRTYEYQVKLFNGYMSKELEAHPTWSEEDVREYVLTYSAAPGTSEHQSGLCMDLFTTEMEGLYNYGSETNNPYDKGFAETDAYKWLCENAHEYGFILRFPKGKENITGYSYESWHYRYVGKEVAKEIHESGLTLEEYLAK